MKKVLIVYGSTTGNTESMAEMVGKSFIDAGYKTGVVNVTDFDDGELTDELSVIILGCPAYGHDTIEFQEDFEEFFEGIDGLDLKGRQFAAFAPGDSVYEYFCGTVDKIEEALEGIGAVKIVEGLKIDGNPDDFEDDINDWSESIISELK